MAMTINKGKVPMVTPADDVPGPRQGHWTYEDYAAIPDDGRRYEILGGVLYMSPSPSEKHQGIGNLLAYYLTMHVQLAGRGRVYSAPLDVELSPDDVVQPDVLVILNANREKITPSRIVGAPDLAIEILSPGSVARDYREKMDAYAQAGAPEYWIVNPDARTIEVFALENKQYRSLGVFEGPAQLPSRLVPDFPVQVKQFFA
ncbi:MAG: Uma2 family endonuclease [Ktedonobacteraceae bacterium]